MADTDQLTDAVVTRLADDLDAGFVDLVRAYEKVVYSVALRVGGPGDAEDLAAEAFLRAYRALLGYDRDRILALRPRPWLLTIVLNTWRNSVREAGRRPSQVPLGEAGDLPGGGPSVEEAAERAETRRDLAVLVAALPTTQRVAVVLRHVVGLPIGEVAAVLGCPDGTAKSHVSRGLRRLRMLYLGRSGGVGDDVGSALVPRRMP
ncbi:RNA polymerase sigma factor [Saccharothrix obliqua]|uniref:RNA polymerase sigma factor n=1 Tax=Saccharothrix obliqua TaxID=2861747 RepID=UPI001C5F0D5B|nr:RNA polymerase sigma factor [Saccharothrix obliqua]MBW4717542.1 RNA polymerase sigma factor [Saccharothrix obliqua]